MHSVKILLVYHSWVVYRPLHWRLKLRTEYRGLTIRKTRIASVARLIWRGILCTDRYTVWAPQWVSRRKCNRVEPGKTYLLFFWNSCAIKAYCNKSPLLTPRTLIIEFYYAMSWTLCQSTLDTLGTQLLICWCSHEPTTWMTSSLTDLLSPTFTLQIGIFTFKSLKNQTSRKITNFLLLNTENQKAATT